MNTQAAMEWLLIHGEDEDIDAPLTEEERERIIQNARDFVPDAEVPRLNAYNYLTGGCWKRYWLAGQVILTATAGCPAVA